jgi:tRNA (guanine26-N2/guanine27-N2)-dimethyltransferase
MPIMVQKFSEFVETIEGKTRLLVPASSLLGRVPSKVPAFFNPSAKSNRDISILVYKTFVPEIKKNPRSFGDPFGGIGARGLRVAVEIPQLEQIYINDLNTVAIEAAKKASEINLVTQKCTFTTQEVVQFLTSHDSKNFERFSVVDLDPFGSPAPYIDCVLRSLTKGGLLSITATDTAVLCGVHPAVCMRKYYGRPLNNHYARETALRLIISLIAITAARLDLAVRPVFVHANLHYLRAYIMVTVSRHDANSVFQEIGYLRDCTKCGNRNAITESHSGDSCELCGSKYSFAGFLWIKRLFDKAFIKKMIDLLEAGDEENASMRYLKKGLFTCIEELDDIPFYFLSDEIASRLRTNPNPLQKIIDRLHSIGYRASRTSLDPNGFKTDAGIDVILDLLK